MSNSYTFKTLNQGVFIDSGRHKACFSLLVNIKGLGFTGDGTLSSKCSSAAQRAQLQCLCGIPQPLAVVGHFSTSLSFLISPHGGNR